jgi:hypothetical protein
MVFLALAVVMVSTASDTRAASLTVNTEFVGAFDPWRLTTCSWAEGQPAANLQFETLIRRSVEAQLRSKGVEVMDGGATCAVRTRVVRSPAFPVAILIVEVLDAERKSIVWRGEASGLTQYPLEKLEKIIAKSIKKMFKEYPRAE